MGQIFLALPQMLCQLNVADSTSETHLVYSSTSDRRIRAKHHQGKLKPGETRSCGPDEDVHTIA